MPFWATRPEPATSTERCASSTTSGAGTSTVGFEPTAPVADTSSEVSPEAMSGVHALASSGDAAHPASTAESIATVATELTSAEVRRTMPTFLTDGGEGPTSLLFRRVRSRPGRGRAARGAFGELLRVAQHPADALVGLVAHAERPRGPELDVLVVVVGLG